MKTEKENGLIHPAWKPTPTFANPQHLKMFAQVIILYLILCLTKTLLPEYKFSISTETVSAFNCFNKSLIEAKNQFNSIF